MRFTIRDVLWLTVVIGLIAAWAVNRSQLIRDYEKQLQEWADLEYKMFEKWETLVKELASDGFDVHLDKESNRFTLKKISEPRQLISN